MKSALKIVREDCERRGLDPSRNGTREDCIEENLQYSFKCNAE